MLIHEARVGMKVAFGRQNGDQTLGEIIKVNPTKAKVRTLESRGNGRGSMVGSVWSVPYSMMTIVSSEGGVVPVVKDPSDDPVVYSRFNHGDNLIMEAIVDTYGCLSPEYLTADGERPMYQVNALRNKLNTRLRHLFGALGRPVSESVAYKWMDDKQSAEKKAV
jgi:hypothetical protein